MEYNMRQSVFFDKFIESTVNHLAFHRTAIAGAKDQVIVDVFISKQIHQLINFFFSLYQHIGNCFRQVHAANTGFGFRLFQDQSSMGTGYARWKLLNNTFVAQIVQCTSCIAINGVLQKISYGEQKDQYMYVQTYEKDDFIKENEDYTARKKITISFEPQINEKDKDLTKLQLTVISVDNPLFRLQPEYPVGFLMHRAATCTVRTLTLNSPITNYTKDEISESGITELDLTDEVIEKYSEMANIAPKAITENTRPFANVDSEYHSHFNFDENGKLDLGFITSVSEDGEFDYEMSSQGRYLVSMFVNGTPHAFPDGSIYKSIDMKPGKLYVYEAQDFSKILGECDTIVFLPVACLRDDGKCIMSHTVQSEAIWPKDKA